jgi:glycosyltransferase involved in cell wall biosynthesis
MKIALHDFAGHPFQFQLSRALAARGHTVRHFYFAGDTGPKGRTTPDPSDPETFSIEPLQIRRPYLKADFVGRWRNDTEYGRITASAIARFQPEVVISGNTPLDAQRTILKGAHSAGAAFVDWVQDFYSLAIARLLSGRFMGLGRAAAAHYVRMERGILAQSDGIVFISEDFRAFAPSLAAHSSDISVIPNWGALDEIEPKAKVNAWSQAHGLSDKFVFLYSGTLGLKHNPDHLLALADAFSDRADVVVAVAAAGLGMDRLKADLVRTPRSNLLTFPLQPFDCFSDLLGSSDVLLALLEDDAGDFSVPSKILSYLCAERPILLSAPLTNLASRVVEGAGTGIVTPSASTEAFLAAARNFYEQSALRSDMAKRGRAYALDNFDIGRVSDRFEAVFERAIAAYRAR